MNLLLQVISQCVDGYDDDEESIQSTEERVCTFDTHELIALLNEFRSNKNRNGCSVPPLSQQK
jgi:hypothetical protein